MFVRPNSILRLGTAGWDPFKDFERFSSEVNHLFSDSNWNNGLLSLTSRFGASFSKTQSGLKLRMEVPGIEPSSLQISVQGEELTLKSSPSDEDSATKRRYLRRERISPTIDRHFKLGFSVDAEKVKATYTNGILEVELPRIQAESPKPISIAVH